VRGGVLGQYGEHGKRAQRSRRGLITPRSRLLVKDGNNFETPALNFYKDSLGFIHRNYRVNVQEHNLELILTLNRLRERTGLLFMVGVELDL
jgi:hypothetical protein